MSNVESWERFINLYSTSLEYYYKEVVVNLEINIEEIKICQKSANFYHKAVLVTIKQILSSIIPILILLGF